MFSLPDLRATEVSAGLVSKGIMLGLKVEQNYLHFATSWALKLNWTKTNLLNKSLSFSCDTPTQMEAQSMARTSFR